MLVSHIDPETLALLALGEPVLSDDERDHLATCPVCDNERRSFEQTIIAGRRDLTELPLHSPPASVWDSIADELQLPRDGEKHVVPRRPRRPRRRRMLIGVASLLAAVSIVAVIFVVSTVRTSAPTIVSEAALDPFPDHPGASGTAEVERVAGGGDRIVVTLSADTAADGFREVWLISSDASQLVSLGVLEGAKATFTVPAGVDLDEFPLVDISQEPEDGDDAHSGDSIVRGELHDL